MGTVFRAGLLLLQHDARTKIMARGTVDCRPKLSSIGRLLYSLLSTRLKRIPVPFRSDHLSIRASIRLHESGLFIIAFTLLAPFRRFILPRFLGFITLFLGLVFSHWVMLSRRIDSNQLQRFIARVDKLMLRTRWHNDNVVRSYVLVFTSYSCLGGS